VVLPLPRKQASNTRNLSVIIIDLDDSEQQD